MLGGAEEPLGESNDLHGLGVSKGELQREALGTSVYRMPLIIHLIPLRPDRTSYPHPRRPQYRTPKTLQVKDTTVKARKTHSGEKGPKVTLGIILLVPYWKYGEGVGEAMRKQNFMDSIFK